MRINRGSGSGFGFWSLPDLPPCYFLKSRVLSRLIPWQVKAFSRPSFILFLYFIATGSGSEARRAKSTRIRMAPDPHKIVLAGMFLHLFIDYLLKIFCFLACYICSEHIITKLRYANIFELYC
jgi:hypothetical protein